MILAGVGLIVVAAWKPESAELAGATGAGLIAGGIGLLNARDNNKSDAADAGANNRFYSPALLVAGLAGVTLLSGCDALSRHNTTTPQSDVPTSQQTEQTQAGTDARQAMFYVEGDLNLPGVTRLPDGTLAADPQTNQFKLFDSFVAAPSKGAGTADDPAPVISLSQQITPEAQGTTSQAATPSATQTSGDQDSSGTTDAAAEGTLELDVTP